MGGLRRGFDRRAGPALAPLARRLAAKCQPRLRPMIETWIRTAGTIHPDSAYRATGGVKPWPDAARRQGAIERPSLCRQRILQFAGVRVGDLTAQDLLGIDLLAVIGMVFVRDFD